jgi:hypothetical protein
VTGNALAHRVNVFAWAEGDIVYVECKFSGGKKITGGSIIVSDPSGVELLTGRTNDQGEFSFKRPQPTELKIILQAGMGHRAEWTLPVDDGHAAHPADDFIISIRRHRLRFMPDRAGPKSKPSSRKPWIKK